MQQNIDFGTFPDDPNADAIREAFRKTQENFDELYNFQRLEGVLSINRVIQPGITVNSPTGNVLITANIAQVQVRTSSLALGLNAPGTGLSATLTSSPQTIYIDLSNNTVISNSLVVGNSTVNSTVTSTTVSTGNVNAINVNTGNITASLITGTFTTLSSSQPNITSVGTLTGLTVNGISNLGSNSNVLISGGNPGDILTTDGFGSLSWKTELDIFGATGATGISGYSGYSGISGYSGYSGRSGFSGFSGRSGFSGWSGISGFSGFSGAVGATGSTGPVGATGSAGFAENVLYVSKSGNDANTGTDLSHAKLTIKAAVAEANALQALNPTGTTVIMVKAGDYTEDNPISLSAGVSIVGDNLRTVSVRPANPTQDIFWVRNKCYLTGMTFSDHLFPSAAVAFPETGAGNIFTSPYVHNCSSITTTGCGMRVDGNLADGLKSMVLDSYTQFNQGGLGIHITNMGYAQIVSMSTICCTAGVKCETGGTCSINNSNSSFGDYGLWADGAGPILYSGTLTAFTRSTLTVTGLSQRPAPNDAVLLTDGINSQYVLVREATLPVSGESVITYNELLDFTPTLGPVDFRQISLISASGQTFEYVGTGTNILTSTPRLGGVPIQANEIRQTSGGRVNFTSTDQFGDFRVGSNFTINEEAGIIQGTTFDRSLFAVLTPYILALEG